MKHKSRIRKRIQKALVVLLALAMLLDVSSMSILAAVDPDAGEILEDTQGDIQEGPGVQADDVDVTGDGPIGDMVADVLKEEQARIQEEIHITSLSFNGATAAVTYDDRAAEGDCELVVAVYADGPEPRQMLASGTAVVSKGGHKKLHIIDR